MRNIMSARSLHESSFSFSRRHFQHIVDKLIPKDHDQDEEIKILDENKKKKKPSSSSISRFRSVLSSAFVTKTKNARLCGTLFGRRRGHVHIAFQLNAKLSPILLLEIAMPTAALVAEMASGLVRIALEIDQDRDHWRAYCNGKKCGYAVKKKECGEEEMRVLKAVEMVTMGAGVLPDGGGGAQGEMMYMRARFERVVGSGESEAFYMLNPDGNGGPELSLYLLRV